MSLTQGGCFLAGVFEFESITVICDDASEGVANVEQIIQDVFNAIGLLKYVFLAD